jgi:replicative DNA helicase
MENSILKHLIIDNDYFIKVFPALKSSHFRSLENSELFKSIQEYYKKYEHKPTLKELVLFIKQNNKIDKSIKKLIAEQLKVINNEEIIENKKFFLDESQKFIQKTELINAIYESAEIIEKDKPFENVLNLIESAISLNFDYNTGLDYNDSELAKYEYYHNIEEVVTTGTKTLDYELNGGFSKKSLNVIVAPSHGGKSAFGISFTCANLFKKKNILFLTLEMPEFEIAKRIDGNLLNHPINELYKLTKDEYIQKVNSIKKVIGKLIIKEYAANEMSVLKLKSLLNELETEKNFKPDIIVIDYLTLMASSRITLAQAGGNYSYYKAIAEELHGFAKKENIPLVTFGQLNRSAYGNMNAGMETIADSLGIIQTADTVMALLTNDKLKEENQIAIKFLKNRRTGKLSTKILNVDFNLMRFFDIEEDKVNNIQLPNTASDLGFGQSVNPFNSENNQSPLNFN